MNKIPAMTLLLSAAFCLGPQAATSQTLTLTATAEPPPCEIVQAPATLDFGIIERRTLEAHTMSALPEKDFAGGLTISCEANTSLGMSVVDNSGGNVIDYGTLTSSLHAEQILATQSDRRFGLGVAANGKPLGVWSVVLHSANVDNAPATMQVVNNGVVVSSDTSATLRNDGSKVSWVSGQQVMEGKVFNVQAQALVGIARLDDLPSGVESVFNGSVTVEITYI